MIFHFFIFTVENDQTILSANLTLMIELKYDILGIIIPTLIISILAYGGHFIILIKFVAPLNQLIFQYSVIMIWLSYIQAIYTNPGKPSSTKKPTNIESKEKFCHKCQNFKPERSHHCKKCQQCVLMMDHHCPWTMNCVGYNNYSHFMRFLTWIIIATSQLGYYLLQRCFNIWKIRNTVSSDISTFHIVSLAILTPFNGFIFLTITILWIRCFMNQIVNGRTQIENWEMDRLQHLYYTRKLLPLLLQQLWITYPQFDTTESREITTLWVEERKRFTIDELVNFPYDMGIITNFQQYIGSIFFIIFPWLKPYGDGIHFPKNDISKLEEDSSIEDALLSLSWPPDGGRNKLIKENKEDGIEEKVEDGEQMVRKRRNILITSKSKEIDRRDWVNDWGEQLKDFGVDVEIE